MAPPTPRNRALWKATLVLPFLGLCFPALYVRTYPTLLGFPFFYWYQFAWVLITSALLFLVYRKLSYASPTEKR